MLETIHDIGEFGLIRRIRTIIDSEGVKPEGLSLGIGDDAASFLPRAGREILVTCDSIVEARHYLPGVIAGYDLGRRAMTSNISDIGAMGGSPLYALVSLGLKGEAAVSEVEGLYRGFLVELNPLAACIIGGNVTESETPFIDITLIGEVAQGKAVRRSGARPGDAVLLTGATGRAAGGLQLLLHRPGDPGLFGNSLVRAYLAPSHRALFGRAAAATGYVTAMIDTSDGLAGDLAHICEESGVGAELFREAIPIDSGLRDAAGDLGLDVYGLAIGESDDYELIMTCDPRHVPDLKAEAESQGVPLTEVGRITDGREICLVLPGGEKRRVDYTSWDHFRR
jgi:thiamine-monophosphate kinase